MQSQTITVLSTLPQLVSLVLYTQLLIAMTVHLCETMFWLITKFSVFDYSSLMLIKMSCLWSASQTIWCALCANDANAIG